jgi:tripartite-type tricarboxylate transporter receptor subunit TctC
MAQTYPSRPVRIIVGQTAGGGQDVFARLIGQWLSVRLGQQFIIDNRPGAGGDIGAAAALRAPADGYTLLLVANSNAINATLHDRRNFNFIRDIAPVASIAQAPLVMEVHPSVPASTVPEFIAYAKANPGQLNMASSGIGTSVHVAGELFKMMTGVNLVHVPNHPARPPRATHSPMLHSAARRLRSPPDFQALPRDPRAHRDHPLLLLEIAAASERHARSARTASP